MTPLKSIPAQDRIQESNNLKLVRFWIFVNKFNTSYTETGRSFDLEKMKPPVHASQNFRTPAGADAGKRFNHFLPPG